MRYISILVACVIIGSCENDGKKDEKIDELKEKITSLEKMLEEKQNSQEPHDKYSQENIITNQTKPFGKELTTRYVFGEIEVEYPGYSGKEYYKDIILQKIMVTNIIEINDYSEEKKYRLLDAIRGKDLPDNGLGNDEKFIEIRIHEYSNYQSASVDRQKIKYAGELDIFLPF